MPVLYWDGEELAQSMAIARFVARKVLKTIVTHCASPSSLSGWPSWQLRPGVLPGGHDRLPLRGHLDQAAQDEVCQEPGGAGGVGQGIPHRVHPKVAEASGGDSCQAWQWVVRRHWRHFCRPGHHVRPRLAAGAAGDVLQGHEQRCRAEEDPRRLSSCEGKLPEDQRSAVCGRVEEKEACLCWVLI